LLQKTDEFVMKNMNYLILFLSVTISAKALGNCQQFETALEAAMKRVMAREEVKAQKSAWGSAEAKSYKDLYGKSKTEGADNRNFNSFMEADKLHKNKDVLYFNVENSIQKTLNDKIIKDKEMVDAINNAFFEKFYKNLRDYPELQAKIVGRAGGFKTADLRLPLKKGDDVSLLERQLNEVYQKANKEFVAEFERMGLSKLLPPRTDGVADVSSWFLSGTGHSALEANLASRSARIAGFQNGSARTMNFRERVALMHQDVMGIEDLRKKLASSRELLDNAIMVKLPSGEVIPSRAMIDILRRTKLSDCDSVADYIAKFRAKVKTQFNADISEQHIDDLTVYFQKSDTLSPPIFERERVKINLGNAKDDIVSVDFTGIGVDNAEAQMKALSSINYNQKDKAKLLEDVFDKVQKNVDTVTDEMNAAKRYFTTASQSQKDAGTLPQFSGDDGIFMPQISWDLERRVQLVRFLGDFKDPSKYRVTVGKVKDASGKLIPVGERSARIVRAEEIEKSLRQDVVGATKIPKARSEKMIFAIDFTPANPGGRYNLILGGQKPTPEERKMILESFAGTLNKEKGEVMGDLIEAFK
jgi:hypothetical protein